LKGLPRIRVLVEECVARDLTEKEAIGTKAEPDFKSFFKRKYGKNIARSTYYDHKKEIFSKDGLSEWFNNHTDIGFVEDHKMRKLEMTVVMKDLMKAWTKLTAKANPHPNAIAGLTHAITDASKALREISLDNPVIAEIKKKMFPLPTPYCPSYSLG